MPSGGNCAPGYALRSVAAAHKPCGPNLNNVHFCLDNRGHFRALHLILSLEVGALVPKTPSQVTQVPSIHSERLSLQEWVASLHREHLSLQK